MTFIVAFFVIVLSVFLGWIVLQPVTVSAKSPPGPTAGYELGVEKPGMDREALAKRLREVSAKPAPKDLKPGALCYEVVGPPDHAEYLCPKCNEKTLYALPKEGSPDQTIDGFHGAIWVVSGELPGCRRLVKEIKGLAVELDESQFCRKCHPEVKGPQLGLVVRYPSQAEPHRFWGVTCDDLRLIADFMGGKTKHVGAADAETPLKDHLNRLRELLGIKAE